MLRNTPNKKLFLGRMIMGDFNFTFFAFSKISSICRYYFSNQA